ncbi:MAG TPA: hypothetical protein VMU19_09590 [Bryobacteraceae bacterium]|nr:hypothetical protein [Bryobacteraceae bacterium]
MLKLYFSTFVLLLLLGGSVLAQSGTQEPAAVVEVGGAASRALNQKESSYGPSAAIEVTPIEDWLELEAGVTPLFTRHSTEWDTDFLFKKPWTLSSQAEFMFGVGPEWMRTRSSGATSNALAGEAVLDFMFWPSARHKLGWYLEPSYDYAFAPGHDRSLGITAGLLIAIPKRHRR